jgi:hypothetical protein
LPDDAGQIVSANTFELHFLSLVDLNDLVFASFRERLLRVLLIG